MEGSEIMEKHCGIKGCIDDVMPGAFIEVEAFMGGVRGDHGISLATFGTVRVEVCLTHFDALTPAPA